MQRVAPQAPAARDLTRIGQWHHANALQQIPAGEIYVCRPMGVLGNQSTRNTFVGSHIVGKAAPQLHAGMGHEVAPHLPAGVRQAVQ